MKVEPRMSPMDRAILYTLYQRWFWGSVPLIQAEWKEDTNLFLFNLLDLSSILSNVNSIRIVVTWR